MLRAFTEQHTKQHMKTAFMRDNTIIPHFCTVFFIWAACFLLQKRLLPWCNQNSLSTTPLPLSLRNGFFRRWRLFFLQVSNTETVQNAVKLASESPENVQILYGHLHTMTGKGGISWATASTSLVSLSQTYAT